MHDERARAFAALDAAWRAGWSGLRQWYYEVSPSARARLAALRVHPPSPRRPIGDIAPLGLEVDGDVVVWLQARIARGNNSDVYLTRDGRVLKLAKTPRSAQKLLLQAWSRPFLVAHDIAAAEVTTLDRDGLFLVQERIDGPTVRDAYRHYSTITPWLGARLLREVARLRGLGLATGLWIDFRDRDVFLRRDGSLVHVDYGPRVNMDGHTTYAYVDEAGERRFHDDERAVMRFFDRADPATRFP